MDMEIRKMEEAAMLSYTQDIHAKRDMTAKNISIAMDNPTPAVETTAIGYEECQTRNSERGQSTSAAVLKRQIDPLRLVGDDSDDDGKFGHYRPTPSKATETAEPATNTSLWVEAKTEDNHTYYWNVKTNESVWEEPAEGFLSWKEFQKINDIAIQQQELQQAKDAQEFQKNVPEMLALYNRERLKLLRPIVASETVTGDSGTNDVGEVDGSVTEKANYATEEEAAAPAIGQWQVIESK